MVQRVLLSMACAIALALLGGCGDRQPTPRNLGDASAGDAAGCDARSCPGDADVSGCSASTCLGCCEQGVCVSGTDPAACGSAGQSCQVCASPSNACVGQRCVAPCGAGTCSGCCSDNQCLPGDAGSACGHGGGACADCSNLGSACDWDGGSGGSCRILSCTPASCPAGCCDADGACQSGNANAACGTGGAACQSCPADRFCDQQVCASSCGPQSCPSGCCDSTGVKCQPGTSDRACGTAGSSCQDCAPKGDICSGQACVAPPPCGPCPGGCCDRTGACQPGTADSLCGSGGAACQDCTASGAQCSSQFCGFSADAGLCGPETCPTGCCGPVGPLANATLTVCMQGLSNLACGTAGQICEDCGLGGICASQQCTAAPDSGGSAYCVENCVTGCCDPNGVCHDPTDTACGMLGAPCVDCTTFGAQCQDICVAPDGGTLCSQTCDGCCDAQGQCQLGFADAQCGQYGATCSDCTALVPASTCEEDIHPRVCTSQQTACPAAYPTCPPGLQIRAPAVQRVCSATDLLDAAAGCADGVTSSPTCGAFYGREASSNPACAACLEVFDFDFVDQTGIRTCVAPYVSAACNHNSACVADCTREACAACDDGTSQCETQAQTGACAAFTQADECITQALSGPAAVCNPTTYQGKFGAWLQAVGAKYCGQ